MIHWLSSIFQHRPIREITLLNKPVSAAILPLIADVYIPALALLCLYQWVQTFRQQKIKNWRNIFQIFAGAIAVFTLMVADDYWRWWPQFGLDYSTHTALAWVFVLALSQTLPTTLASLLSMTFYMALMHYLDYHTVMDMFTTTVVVVAILWALKRTPFSFIKE